MGEYDPSGLAAQLADVERRLRALESAPRLSSASLTDGAFVVTDTNGVVKVRLGLLADGTYGLEQVDPMTGKTVPLSAIALGTRTDGIGPASMTNSPTYVDLGGPEVTVDVPATGNVEVILSAMLTVPAGGGTGLVGLSVDAGAAYDVLVLSSAAGMESSGARVDRITGLTPGLHTLRLKYAANVGAGLAGSFANRYLLARPY